MTRSRWVLSALAALAIIGAGAYYWEFLEAPAFDPAAPFDLDMTQVRRLADSLPGDHPTAIRFEHVMDFKAPAAVTITGGGWSQATMWGIAYQLIYPDHTMIVDTAMSDAQAKSLGTVSGFYPEAYARMIQAMSAARLIVITHEHPDHIGGLAAHPDAARLFQTGVVKLTREQTDNPIFMKPVTLAPAILAGYEPLVYERYAAIAPGVVLIKAPGHSPGSQMVFVHEADGTGILFLGDVAWTMRNVKHVRGRPRYIGNMINEDRKAVIAQLAAIHSLAEAEPKLVIVPGHDGGTMISLKLLGVMKEGFE